MSGELLKKLKTLLETMNPKEVIQALTPEERLIVEAEITSMQLGTVIESAINKG